MQLMVTKYRIFLSLPRTDKTPDLQDIIISTNLQALEWGKILFCHFRSGSL
jgi:predicted transcriptional regulator